LQTGQIGGAGIFCPNPGDFISTTCFVPKQASQAICFVSVIIAIFFKARSWTLRDQAAPQENWQRTALAARFFSETA
jgi:hypothetical protein